jgi:hypothetical protein
MSFYSSMRYLIKKYKLNITHLAYKLSSFYRKRNSVSNSKIQAVYPDQNDYNYYHKNLLIPNH